MKRFIILLFMVALTCTGSYGQSYSITDLGIKTAVDSIGIEIQFYSPSIVRIVKWPEGQDFSKESLSVIMTPRKTDLVIKQKGTELIARSKNLTVSLNLISGKISFMTPVSDLLLSESEAGAMFTGFNDAGTNTFSAYQAFVL
ncbi:MAG: DUF4968 domain-containing protein, partial [Bacteroidales bacterium]|nr:DUF4968 domain-containing protein [Bacteroidales bacterium]